MRILANTGLALRLLARRPFYSAAIVLSLLLGIGLNTAVFSLVNALLLRPVPGVQDPDRVVSIYTGIADSSTYLPVSYPNYRDLRAEAKQVTDLAAHQGVRLSLEVDERAELVTGAMVTASYFDALGVRPARGRFFSAEEDSIAGGPRLVVLSDALWRRRFGADPGVLGESISLNGSPFTVIGVAPAGFRGPRLLAPAQLWVTLATYREVFSAADLLPHRSNQVLQVVGRLRPDVSLQQAKVEVRELGNRLRQAYPDANRDQRLITLPLAESAISPNARGDFFEVGAFLVAAAGLLGLIACVNVANLVLARTLERRSELGIRLSQGASMGHLMRLVLTEVLVLWGIAVGGSFLVLTPTARWLWSLRPPFLRADVFVQPLDARVILVGLALALAAAALTCVAPLLRVLGSDPNTVLKERVLSGESRRRWALPSSGALVSFQAALAVAALACASSFVGSLQRVRAIDPGFDTRGLVMVSLDFQFLRADEAEARALRRRILENVSALPGSRDAAFAENRLLDGARVSHRLAFSVGASNEETGGRLVASNRVGPHYIRTAGIPLLNGREIDRRDQAESTPVALVNETLAEQLWPEGDALGEHVFIDEETTPVEVVGVVGDTPLFALGEPPRPYIYLPAAQRYSPVTTLHVRTRGQAQSAVGAIRRAVRAAAPGLPVVEVQTVQQALERSLWWRWAGALLLALFSAAATVLAAVGVYGVSSQAFRRRSVEMGIRRALGARNGHILALAARRAALLAGAGAAVGIPTSVVLHRLARVLLYGQQQFPWLALAMVVGLVLATSLAASLLPAARITRAEPALTLRSH